MAFWRSIQHKYNRWADLSRPERALLIRAAVLLPMVRLKRYMGFQKVQNLLENEPFHGRPLPCCNDMPLQKARQAARMVSIAANHALFNTSCLDRSIVLCILLGRMGIDGDLHLGVKKDGGVFAAHAWVELNGKVVNDTADVRDRFAPFPAPITTAGPYASTVKPL